MFADEGLPEELKSFEAELSTLAPVASRIDRDRLMYRLGAQAALSDLDRIRTRDAAIGWHGWLQRPRVWQAAALVLACTSLALGSLLIGSPRYIDRVVYLPRPDAPSQSTNATGTPNNRIGELDVKQPPITIVAVTRSRLKPNERWLTAMAASGFDYPQNAELRARAPRIASDPGAPIIVVDQRHAAMPSGKVEGNPGAPPLRWSDHRQWIEFLNPANH